ncbi:hornerin-like isoform X3 [Euwallacea similis]|uniref:hornerin-like isoform X3 n=1 Tax=Euwallacea similis TaxID=1736056 RepID=UPI00344B0176
MQLMGVSLIGLLAVGCIFGEAAYDNDFRFFDYDYLLEPNVRNSRQVGQDNSYSCSSEGIFHDNANCRRFYRCVPNGNRGYIPYAFECSVGTVYDPTIAACNYPYASSREECGGNDVEPPRPIQTFSTTMEPIISSSSSYWSSSTSSFESSDASTVASAPNRCTSAGFRQDSVNCRKFYRCIDNGLQGYTQYEFTCAPGTIFDPSAITCNYPWAVQRIDCTQEADGAGSSSSSQSQQTGSISNQNQQTGSGGTTSGQNQNNNQSWQTGTAGQSNQENQQSGSTGQTQQVGSNQSGQAGTDQSNSSQSQQNQNQQTGSQQTTGGMNQLSGSSGNQSTTERPGQIVNNQCALSGFVGDSENCKKFYRCVENGQGGYIKYDFTCVDGTVWDDGLQTCNYAHSVRGRCYSAQTGITSPTGSNQGGTMQTQEGWNQQGSQQQTGSGSNHQQSGTQGGGSNSGTSQNQGGWNQQGSQQQTGSGSNQQQSGTQGGGSNSGTSQNQAGWNQQGSQHQTGSGSNQQQSGTQGGGSNSGTSQNQGEWNQQGSQQQTGPNQQQSGNQGGSSNAGTSQNQGGWNQQGSQQQTGSGSNQQQSGTQGSGSNSGTSQNQGGWNQQGSQQQTGSGSNQQQSGTQGSGSNSGTSQNQGGWNQQGSQQQTGSGSNQQQSGTTPGNQGSTTTGSTSQNQGGWNQQGAQQPTGGSTGSQGTTSITSPAGSATQGQLTNNLCSQEGFIGDNQNCQKFYRCVENGQGGYIKYEYLCGNGTVWNQSILSCNHAFLASGNCYQSASPDNIQPTQTGTSNQPSNPNQPTYPNGPSQATGPAQPNEPYQPETASQPTYPNKPSQPIGPSQPNLPSGPTQQPGSPTGQPTRPTTERPGQLINDLCASSGFVGDQRNCKKFYRCVDNGRGGFTKYDYNCGDATVWDQDTQTCNYPYAVRGSCYSAQPGIVNPGQEESRPSGPSQPSNFNQPTTPNPTNVSNQTSGPQQPTGITQEPDPNQSRPNEPYPNQPSGTGTSSVTQPTGQNTSSVDRPCNCKNQTNTEQVYPGEIVNNQCVKEGYVEDEKNCAKFYRCVNSGQVLTKYEYTCGTGTVWDQSIFSCNHPSAVGGRCSQMSPQAPEGPGSIDQLPPALNETSPTSSGSCTQDGYLGHEQNCSKFYRCVANGRGGYIQHEFSCGPGTVWDQQRLTCNHPWEVEGVCRSQEPSLVGTTLPGSEITTTTTGYPIKEESSGTARPTASWSTSTPLSETESTTEVADSGTTTTLITESTETDHTSPVTVESTTADQSFTERESTTISTENSSVPESSTLSVVESSSLRPEQTTQITEEINTLSTTTLGPYETTLNTESSTLVPEQTTLTQLATVEPNSELNTVENTELPDATLESTTLSVVASSSLQPEQTTQTTEEINILSTTTFGPHETTLNTESSTMVPEQTTFTQLPTAEPNSEPNTPSTVENTELPDTTLVSSTTTFTPFTMQTVEPSNQTEHEVVSTEQNTDSTSIDIGTEQSTFDNTESTTGFSTTTGGNATHMAECPIGQLEGDQIALVCPTGFRRHPKYCNLFYQCTSSDGQQDFKILVLSCPQGTIFDDKKIQCLAEGETVQTCTGQIAQSSLYRMLDINALPPVHVPTKRSLCPYEGSHEIEPTECSEQFLKCQRNHRKMEGFLYQCPEGFAYWQITRQCERTAKLLHCAGYKMERSKWQIPIETTNVSYRRRKELSLPL